MSGHEYINGRLVELRNLHKTTPASLADLRTAIASETGIFVDILPSYKVLTGEKRRAADKNQLKSKETLILEKIEQEIVQQYQKFLDHLKTLTKRKELEAKVLGFVSLCKLLPAAAYFNFSTQLIELIVLGTAEQSHLICEPCGKALQDMFDTDGQGAATLKALQFAVQLVKNRKFRVQRPLFLATLFIKMSLIDPHHAEHSKQLRTKAGTKSVEKETDDFKRLQTQVFERLLALYLRALEVAAQTKGHVQNRVEPALQGLARVAHLLNTGMMGTLLAALKDILNNTATSTLVGLQTIITASTLIGAVQHKTTESGQFMSSDVSLPMSVDQKAYYDHLYRLIPLALAVPTLAECSEEGRARQEVGASTGTGGEGAFVNPAAEHARRVHTLLRALKMFFLRPGVKVGVERALAFARRLSLYGVSLPPFMGHRVFAIVQALSMKYPEVGQLAFTRGDEQVGGAAPNWGVNDPDLANAKASNLWEITLLQNSADPRLLELSGSKFLAPDAGRVVGTGHEDAPLPGWDFEVFTRLRPTPPALTKKDTQRLTSQQEKQKRQEKRLAGEEEENDVDGMDIVRLSDDESDLGLESEDDEETEKVEIGGRAGGRGGKKGGRGGKGGQGRGRGGAQQQGQVGKKRPAGAGSQGPPAKKRR